VGDSSPRPWQEIQGPATPFSASKDAENGSSSPNRNLHKVILSVTLILACKRSKNSKGPSYL
jgi:hypothetical protein